MSHTLKNITPLRYILYTLLLLILVAGGAEYIYLLYLKEYVVLSFMFAIVLLFLTAVLVIFSDKPNQDLISLEHHRLSVQQDYLATSCDPQTWERLQNDRKGRFSE